MGSVGEEGRTGLKDRLAERSHLDRTLRAKPPRSILEAPLPSAGIPEGADAGLWVRMFASALFDADYLDAEAFFDPTVAPGRAAWPASSSLLPKLDAQLAPDLGLMDGKSPKGAEKVASRWADYRTLPQIGFAPDWTKHRRAAPLKRDDQIFEVPLMSELGGGDIGWTYARPTRLHVPTA